MYRGGFKLEYFLPNKTQIRITPIMQDAYSIATGRVTKATFANKQPLTKRKQTGDCSHWHGHLCGCEER